MPQAIPIIAAVVSIAASAYTAVSASQTGKYNQKVYEQNAKAAKDKAAYDENLHRERVRKLLSAQRAEYGKSGVDMTGTPLLVMEDTVGQGELDALAIRYGGDVDAARLRSEGRLAKMKGNSEATAGYVKAGSSLLSSGYSAYASRS